MWLKLHWTFSVVLGIPIIIVGWVLGPLSVSKRGRRHVVNEHQVCVHDSARGPSKTYVLTCHFVDPGCNSIRTVCTAAVIRHNDLPTAVQTR